MLVTVLSILSFFFVAQSDSEREYKEWILRLVNCSDNRKYESEEEAYWEYIDIKHLIDNLEKKQKKLSELIEWWD